MYAMEKREKEIEQKNKRYEFEIAINKFGRSSLLVAINCVSKSKHNDSNVSGFSAEMI